jgi:hypothetical protein
MATKKEQILELVRELFGDDSVPREQTKEDLEEIETEVQTFLYALDSDD